MISLLAEFQYEARTDHLIFAGDFISKGPNSPAVVDLAMSAHASCVRGNHEDRVILAYRDMYAHRLIQEQAGKPLAPAPGMPEDMQQNEPEDDEIEQERFSRGDAVDRQLAGSFTKAQIDYIASCSVILDIGRIKGLGDLHVVHAGLIPGVRLERQDPMGVMHMRTIDLDTHVPSSSGKGMPWFKVRPPSTFRSSVKLPANLVHSFGTNINPLFPHTSAALSSMAMTPAAAFNLRSIARASTPAASRVEGSLPSLLKMTLKMRNQSL